LNTKMLKDPMLYLASITSSFLFGFIESYFGIFEFHITEYEVTVIVAMSIIGIFASLVIYASFSSIENKVYSSIRVDTRNRMKKEGWRPPSKRRR
jgi:hypothetical protein